MVCALSWPRSLQPPSMAEQIAPLVTLWQEQTIAASGKAPGPRVGAPAEDGRIRLAGSAGKAMPFCAYCNKVS
ncbi:hypothetical protein D3C75_1347320 [compost metagenome]